ncbi:MAG TPA: NINE protein [Edaphocola sp.]|nr:NINE protein [Edaphocola sp.]
MLLETEKYCKDCGKVISKKAEICPNCGVRQMAPPQQAFVDAGRKVNDQWIATLALCFFAGYLGIHNFYNRKVGYGILQILTLGGLGIWVLIDLIMIVTNNFKNNEGEVVAMYSIPQNENTRSSNEY